MRKSWLPEQTGEERMSEPHPAPETAHHEPAHTTTPFTEGEWQEFHAEDIHAARAIVCLMAGIFTVGLVLYATVAAVVAS
jgi:hypothetical protein